MEGRQTDDQTRDRSEAARADSPDAQKAAEEKPAATAGTAEGATATKAAHAGTAQASSQSKASVAGETALLPDEQSERFTSRWQEIQTGFVDRPQQAVEQADALVVDLMQRVTGSLAKERERLESQWARGDEVSTEDLRIALTRYRSFFDRLLST
jgi:hypothetical protein